MHTRFVSFSAILAVCAILPSGAKAQSLEKVSGNLISLSIADAGGWSGITECNCSGSDYECDLDMDWPTATSSAVDTDYGVGIECCEAKTPVCASSGLSLTSISANVKNIVWTPKVFCQELPYPADAPFTYAYGFNDLILKVVDASNPSRKFNIDARVVIESTTADPVYIEVGDDASGALFSLSVTAALTEDDVVELDESYGCADGEYVSAWDDVVLFSDGWEEGCSAIQEDTGWTALGTVCQGDEFRLGFQMLAAGLVDCQTHGVFECTNPPGCLSSYPLRVSLQIRAISAGVDCP